MSISLPVFGPVALFSPDEKLTTTAAKEARRLHGLCIEAREEVGKVETDHAAARREVQEAEAALAAQVRGCASDTEAEVAIADRIQAARLKADPFLHRQRHFGALGRAHEAAVEYERHLTENFDEIADELRPEAEAAAEELASARATLSVAEARYGRAAARSQDLAQLVMPKNWAPAREAEMLAERARWAVPVDGSVPLPLPAFATAAREA